MFDYKQIGNLAAKVITALAVAGGGALWFARNATPDSPRNLDEADIMTAILERHAAMGRTNVFFGKAYAENTSWRTVTNAPSVMATGKTQNATQTYVQEQGSGRKCIWSKTAHLPWDEEGIHIYDEVSTNDFIVQIVGTNFVGKLKFSSVTNRLWLGAGTNIPQVLVPNSGGLGNLCLTSAPPGTLAGVRAIFTNSAAHTDTNTVGMAPSAIYGLPFALRSAFLNSAFNGWFATPRNFLVPSYTWGPPRISFNSPGTPNEYSGNTGWIIPDDEYMTTGGTNWFGSTPMTNVWVGPASWFVDSTNNQDYSYTLKWATSALPRAEFVWTNYIAKPLASYSINGSNSTLARNTWAFTNKYPTFHEISGMAFPFERDTQKPIRVDPFFNVVFGTTAADDKPQKNWTTNAYHDMARAATMMQWVREYRTQNEGISMHIRFTNTLSSAVFKSYEAETNATIAAASGGLEDLGSQENGRIRINIRICKYIFTNNLPFTVDNLNWYPDAHSTGDNWQVAWGIEPPHWPTAIAPGGGAVTDWWPLTEADMYAFILSTFTGWTNGMPGFAFSTTLPCHFFHVQFESLTNYINHAPAR
jgi:hypothetical protein